MPMARQQWALPEAAATKVCSRPAQFRRAICPVAMPRPHAMDTLLVLITCADAAEARRIGTALVEEHLAACVHLRPHEAIYRWQGQIEIQPEYTLLAKTVQARFAALQARVLDLHSYELPGIVAVKAGAGLPAFLDWIAAETRTGIT